MINRESLYKSLIVCFVLLFCMFLDMTNAEILLFPLVPDYADIQITSDPDYPCFEFSYFANDSNSDFNKIKFGNRLGIIINHNNVLDNLLLINGFVEFSDNYGLWRGNASLWIVNNFNILKDKDITVIVGVNHESNHYGSGSWSLFTFPLKPTEISIVSEVPEFNYFNMCFKGSTLIGDSSKITYAIGGKYFISGDILIYLEEKYGYYADCRDYKNGYNTEILYEYLFRSKTIKSAFISFYYEKINTNIVKDYYDYGEFNKDSLITLILKLGVNIKTEAIIYQPFISYSFSNQRSVYFMIRHELFNIGVRMIPIITKINND